MDTLQPDHDETRLTERQRAILKLLVGPLRVTPACFQILPQCRSERRILGDHHLQPAQAVTVDTGCDRGSASPRSSSRTTRLWP